jgi:transcriptional regulator with XRE-family HTH domain
MTTVGTIIKERLDEKGWSIRELARRSDLPQATVHKIITGETTQPRMETLEQIARPLGISVKSLLAAAAHDAGYVVSSDDPDGLGLLIAGMKELSPARRVEIAALVEAMMKNDIQ